VASSATIVLAMESYQTLTFA